MQVLIYMINSDDATKLDYNFLLHFFRTLYTLFIALALVFVFRSAIEVLYYRYFL